MTLAVLALLVAAPFRPPTLPEMAERMARRPAELPARLAFVTAPLVGAPYVLSPLGEGHGADPDPRLRFDAFDCTTFVETALALALAPGPSDLLPTLDVLRYRDGSPGFLARRHFPEAEWLPELTQLGVLEDITRSVGGTEVVVETKALSPSTWRRHKNERLPVLPPARIPEGVFSLDVWPLDKARAATARIPTGTILNVVRVNFANVPVRVSHQGIVLEKDGQRILRHAADRLHHRVVDEPLDAFLERMQRYSRWPVAGVNLAGVRAPAALPMVRAPRAAPPTENEDKQGNSTPP